MSTAPDVVIHVTSDRISDWKRALTNVRNLYQDESIHTPPTAITLVVNGEAVRFLLEHSVEANTLTRMAEAGITIDACGNSLDRFGHDPDTLAPGVSVVPSGVAEAVRLQGRGVSYLRLP